MFVIALELLHLTYHPQTERGAVLRHGAALLCFVLIALWVSPSSLALIVLTAVLFGANTVTDARRRHMSDRTA